MVLTKKKTFVAAFMIAALAAFVLLMSGCSSDPYAAKVNGKEISEKKITTSIENIRSSYSMTDADTWGKYLAQSSMTPSSLRDQILDSLISQEIVRQYANEKDCSVSSDEIDSQVKKIRENYSDDTTWNDALKSAGFSDESEYRSALEYSMLYKKLGEKFAEDVTIEDSQLLEDVKTKVESWSGEARKSSHILFSSSDEEKAKEVLEKIRNGEISFEDAAKENSTDTSSAEDGGNVGWDKDTSFVEAYQTALNGLAEGEISEPIKSDYGWHIIKCTGVWTKPAEITSLDQCPSDLVDEVRESDKSTQGTSQVQTWIEEKKNSASIEKKDMPSDVSYNVDMSKYQTSSSSSSDSSTTDGSTSSDSSSSSSGNTSTDSSNQSSGTDSSSTENKENNSNG